jgi:hypothetical protein
LKKRSTPIGRSVETNRILLPACRSLQQQLRRLESNRTMRGYNRMTDFRELITVHGFLDVMAASERDMANIESARCFFLNNVQTK